MTLIIVNCDTIDLRHVSRFPFASAPLSILNSPLSQRAAVEQAPPSSDRPCALAPNHALSSPGFSFPPPRSAWLSAPRFHRALGQGVPQSCALRFFPESNPGSLRSQASSHAGSASIPQVGLLPLAMLPS